MKLKSSPSESDASVVKFGGITLTPPMLPSSTYHICFFSCALIEHIILYMSVILFLIYFSNTLPCNFVQMDVLYQVTFLNQYGLCFSI